MCLEARGKLVVGAVLPNLHEVELMPARAVWAAALQVNCAASEYKYGRREN